MKRIAIFAALAVLLLSACQKAPADPVAPPVTDTQTTQTDTAPEPGDDQEVEEIPTQVVPSTDSASPLEPVPAEITATDNTVEEFPDWENTNNAYFTNLYDYASGVTDGSWKVIKNFSLNDNIEGNATNSIVVEVLEAGTGSGCPMYTDSVLVSYRGRLLPSTSYADGYVFSETYEGDYNAATAGRTALNVADRVDGFTTALQYMHIGDYWRVYIPYQLGYGSTGSDNIPGYSTLVFDIALHAYYRAGTPVGSRSAETGVWITE